MVYSMPLGYFIVTIVVTIVTIPAPCNSVPVTTVKPDQALVITTTPDSPVVTDTSKIAIDNSSVNHRRIAAEDSSPEEFGQAIDSAKSSLEKKNVAPEIYSFKVHSHITYRYARTYVTSRVVNAHATNAQEVTFRVVLPETAFISKFIMEIDGTPYEAYVKGKEEAKKVYVQAQSQGQSAGLVELNTRNANVFDVSVNIKSQSKVNFNLTYEELLSRRLGRYEQSISVTPEQITNVKDFQISVSIEESQNITLLRVPNLRNDVNAPADSDGNNQDAVIERPAGNKANITWRPSAQDQNQLSKQGVTGKFIVQYDIKRELDAGEVLVMNGYFVHFFAPENLPPLRKHVVFVLDTSGSMWGRRMEQLKEAMNSILPDLGSDDFFNILTFSGDVVLWSPDDKTSVSSWSPPPFHGERVVTTVEDPRRRQPYPATKENIAKAQKFIQGLVASGGTNIHDSIVQALNLTASIKKNRATVTVTDEEVTTTVATTAMSSLNILPPNVESLLMFLTDGEATVGVTNPSTIVTLIQEANKNISVPIFALGFGSGTDFPLIRKIALQNNGFARKIYEAADAALQLKGFYQEIASPLLANVKFNYTTPESAYTVQNVTITRFPTVFRGTEIAVAGRLVPKPLLEPEDTESPTTDTVTTDVTEEPSAEDSVDTLLTPTTQKYFDVEIEGSGRDGEVLFLKPEIFSCIVPWDGIVIRPFPPRPTPAPTQEDVFLERLWAYLTIQQLIEKDLAQDSNDNELDGEEAPIVPTTTVATVTEPTRVGIPANAGRMNITVAKETPREKALRLALKYGFVTSLTSLVVVKPNSTDVSNTVAADANPDSPDSLASPQSFQSVASHKVAFMAGSASFTTNRINAGGNSNYDVGFSPLSHSFLSAAAPGMPGPPQQIHAFRPSPIHIMATQLPSVTAVEKEEEEEEEEEESEVNLPIPTPPRPSTSYATATPPLPVTTTPVPRPTTEAAAPKNLTLTDLVWFTNTRKIVKDGVEYNVSKDDSVKIDNPANCTVTGMSVGGQCVHLKDCVQPVFLNDYDLYLRSYFCPIDSSAPMFAGVCCVRPSDVLKVA